MEYKNYRSKQGFTIVELLIVIVVIGILAAITIVAYNGIQARAQVAAVSSGLTQTNQKLALYLVDNAAYPPDLATAGITNSGATSYQYSVNNLVTPQTYCVTATNGSTSYRASSAATAPTSGGCPGHGVGGISAITNISTNPSVELNNTGYGVATWGTSGTGTTGRDASRGFAGSSSYRMLYTVASTSSAGVGTPAVNVTAGTTYTFSIYIMVSKAITVGPAVRQYTGPLGTGSIADTAGTTTSVPANTWTRISNTVTITAGNQSAGFRIGLNSNFAVNDTINLDANLITEGSGLYNYADGSSVNWVWNGVANNSTSIGPAL